MATSSSSSSSPFAQDPYRRQPTAATSSSISASSHPRTIPPAPPLPPDHQSRPTAPGFLDRFLYGPRRLQQQYYHHQQQQQQQQQLANQHHQHHAVHQSARELKGQLLFTQNFGHASSQSTSHRTGLKLRALDINESRSHVVLAGVKILKTVRVHQASCTEDVNIRSAAVNYVWKDDRSSSQDLVSAQRETFDIEDVAWSTGHFSSNIATAASNGKIMLYDLNRPGVEVGRLYEHHRQVHKVDFNPHEGQFLLSGSQDGTVRLWDLRSPRRVIECKSKDTFPGRSDGIRHTKWSPTNNWSFALGTDNGTIQRWDIRQNSRPILKILAHTKTCTSIDWHPDGRHMISASKDQDVKVWDLLADRKQKPAYEIRCPKPVQNVRWRPPCYVADGPEQWVKQCTHFATSYRHHPLVHVWDLRRPSVPHREFHHQVNTGTTDLMWHSQDLLWTVGPEGEFCQSDVRYIPRVIDRRPLQTFAVSPSDDISLFNQARPRAISSGSEIHRVLAADHQKQRHSGSPNTGSYGRGDSQPDDSFLSLGTSLPKRHSRSSSFRSGGSLAATPPSHEDFAKPVMHLDQTMDGRSSEINDDQVAVLGQTPESQLDAAYMLLCQRFEPFLAVGSLNYAQAAHQLDEHLSSLHETSAAVGDYEAAQAVLFLKIEFDRILDEAWSEPPGPLNLAQSTLAWASKTTSRGRKPTHKALASILNERARPAGSSDDSASDATTPLVRPLRQPPGAEDRPETPTINLGAGRLFDSPEAPRLSLEAGDEHGGNETREDVSTTHAQPVPRIQGSLAPAYSYQGSIREPAGSVQAEARLTVDPQRLSLDRRGSPESLQIFPTSWGTEARVPVIDSNASSWAKNAAENYVTGRHPSFRSQTSETSDTWRSENGTVDTLASGESSQGDSSTAQDSPTGLDPGTAYASKPNSADLVGLDGLAPDAASSTQPDSVSLGAISRSDGQATDDDERDRGASPTSHAETKTAMEGSVQSLGPVPARHEALGGTAPRAIQAALETLRELLEFHSAQDEVRAASQLFLSIAPILPYLMATVLSVSEYAPQPSFAEAISNTTSLSASAVDEALWASHAPLEAAHISPLYVESLLSTLHAQMYAKGLHQEAAVLRRISFPAFPGVYAQGTKEMDVGTFCTACRSPIANNTTPLRCETCRTQHADCPICLSTTSPFPLAENMSENAEESKETPAAGPDTLATSLFPLATPPAPPPAAAAAAAAAPAATALWTGCGVCAHSSHAACARAWFADPAADGICPVAGCLCDCTPGAWRDERREAAAAQAAQAAQAAGPGGAGAAGVAAAAAAVRTDDWEVGESSAVRKVAGSLRRGGARRGGEGVRALR